MSEEFKSADCGTDPGDPLSTAIPDDDAKRLRSAAERLITVAREMELRVAEREELDLVLAEIVGTGLDHFGPRLRAPRGAGAKRKILDYLQARLASPVHGEELAIISGIQEWPRRVRELRVQEGYEIVELGGSIYRLERAEPNLERARQWQIAHEIRNSLGSAMQRIGRFFEANVGDLVTRTQIDYVSGIAEGSRRIRELRDYHGWPIASHIDEEDLQPGEYRLLSADANDRRDPLQRLYPEDLRRRVFERDRYTCTSCLRNREKALAAGDTRFYLEVHHRVAIADDLANLPAKDRNDIENLVTLCHADHLKETAALQKRKAIGRRGVPRSLG